jgi:predicted nucleic acid-binding protein
VNVLVDTSIWSLALRRRQPANSAAAAELEKLIRAGRVKIIGAIRQEILSGMADAAQFENLKTRLRAFRDLPLSELHHERAAELHNQCRRQGVQGSHTDFLICAVAQIENLEIYTTDKDFAAYAELLALRLYS